MLIIYTIHYFNKKFKLLGEYQKITSIINDTGPKYIVKTFSQMNKQTKISSEKNKRLYIIDYYKILKILIL